MAKYLDETGLAYFWSKAKKHYKIATFTTKKEHFENSLTLNNRNAFLKLSDIASNINETIPSVYKVALITNASFLYYSGEANYQNDKATELNPGTGYVYVSSIDASGYQNLIAHMNNDIKMYGCKFRFMAILERA